MHRYRKRRKRFLHIKEQDFTQIAFRISTELQKRMKLEARKQNRSLNNFVESVLMDAVYRTPNNETLEAMEEARESRNLETINLDNLEGFIESL